MLFTLSWRKYIFRLYLRAEADGYIVTSLQIDYK